MIEKRQVVSLETDYLKVIEDQIAFLELSIPLYDVNGLMMRDLKRLKESVANYRAFIAPEEKKE